MIDDFTGTREVPEKYRFNIASLETYMLENIKGFTGPLMVEQFKGGQSNPTFLLTEGEKRYVLRRKPPGKLLASAHAVDREYRVITALRETDVPVARTYCLCQDDSIIGTWFYIMDFVAGTVPWDPSFPGMENSRRTDIYQDMNRVIARLHKVDYVSAGLADYGRSGNYIERQIGRWIKQYRASETERMEDIERLIEWLPQNIPPGDETAIVHGDYRLDNIILHPDEPRILAVLDWELSTLGHPLADFAYHCMNWHVPYSEYKGLCGLDLKALGIPTEEEYIAQYCRNSGREIISTADWGFYMALSFFRIAAISQGIKARALDGTASSRRAVEYGARTPRYAQLGRQQLEKTSIRHY